MFNWRFAPSDTRQMRSKAGQGRCVLVGSRQVAEPLVTIPANSDPGKAPDRTRKDTRMRKSIPLMVMAGAALLAACGSTQKFNSASLEKLKQSQEPPTVQYLPIYNGIATSLPTNIDLPPGGDGYPLVFPDVARILVPKQLEAAIKGKNLWINHNYIGPGSPTKRLEIYSAKMFLDVNEAVVPQYVNPTSSAQATYVRENVLPDIRRIGGPFYDSALVPLADMSNTNPFSLLYDFTGVPYPTYGTVTVFTAVSRHDPMISTNGIPGVSLPPGNRACFRFTLPAKSFWGGSNRATDKPNVAPVYFFVCVKPQPGNLSHVLPGIDVYESTTPTNGVPA